MDLLELLGFLPAKKENKKCIKEINTGTCIVKVWSYTYMGIESFFNTIHPIK